ncbi:hypothetical protein J4N42_20185 [Vibrio sp. SCSIO 43135]|uniref:Uncharacterized protein n=1 Tax=Vibrio paucivorans TaxID=2829489 RepID=A0A9X3CE29_9VIBR|nr:MULTISPECIES: hypothetical protein [Vibrio]MCW8334144.1 hypothetical protein [Vibrio paucivorans]USD42931.1 hypothetical protein J4N42_20185 [Vibrio sp. SCSIO 43135]
MHLRFFKYVWFTLLATLLPSQAFAYLAQSEADAGNRLSSYKYLPAYSSLNVEQIFIELEGQDEVSTGSVPVSESNIDVGAVGIINANRWSYSSRNSESNDTQSGADFEQFNAHLPPHKLYQLAQYEIDFWAGDVFSSDHRISGWKESNALYVALNSQF